VHSEHHTLDRYNRETMRHIVFEGLPAAGKSETLQLLARFYPERVRVLPELVKEVVLRSGIDLFRDRAELTRELIAWLPERERAIRRIVEGGFLCLEESHLGVHLAYARALGDDSFVEAYETLEEALPRPEAYVRLEIPVDLSVERQAARATPSFSVDRAALFSMLEHLEQWHIDRGTRRLRVSADRPPAETIAEIERHLELSYRPRTDAFRDTFDVLLLLGRPASGKSEFIDFMCSCPSVRRADDFHIGPFEVIDDFPILWQLFEDDDLWERLGRHRLYSRRCNGNYAVTDCGLWPFLTAKIDRVTADRLAESRAVDGRTLIVEFSRGGPSGYADALSVLSHEILRRAAILYVSVSFEESWRRNLARYDETDRGGILTHSVPREEMEKTYGTDDWFRIAPHPVGTIEARGVHIPYATMGNEPESTDPAVLGPRYRSALEPLFDRWTRTSPGRFSSKTRTKLP